MFWHHVRLNFCRLDQPAYFPKQNHVLKPVCPGSLYRRKRNAHLLRLKDLDLFNRRLWRNLPIVCRLAKRDLLRGKLFLSIHTRRHCSCRSNGCQGPTISHHIQLQDWHCFGHVFAKDLAARIKRFLWRFSRTKRWVARNQVLSCDRFRSLGYCGRSSFVVDRYHSILAVPLPNLFFPYGRNQVLVLRAQHCRWTYRWFCLKQLAQRPWT